METFKRVTEEEMDELALELKRLKVQNKIKVQQVRSKQNERPREERLRELCKRCNVKEYLGEVFLDMMRSDPDPAQAKNQAMQLEAKRLGLL